MKSGAKKLLIGLGVAAVLGVIVVASVVNRDRTEGMTVDLEEVQRQDISRIVKASGSIDPRIKVDLSTHVVGRIEHLYVEEGDEIRRGEPFLQLEQQAFLAARDDWQARLQRARTDVRRAQVELADRQLQMRRMERLTGEGIVSQERLDQAQLALTSAELALEDARESVTQARANLVKAEDDLAKTTIFAPLTGRIIDLNAEEGEVVVSGTMNNPASVIGTIADLSEILAEVDVDETEIPYVRVGQEARLEVDALPDRPYRGRVVEVGSSGYTRRQQQDVIFFRVKVLLENPDRALLPGMSVRAEINTATREDVPLVPIQAVVQRPPTELDAERPAAVPTAFDAAAGDGDREVPVVFVVRDGQAVQRAVETGISTATHVEIVRGLEAGEDVVVGPYRSLRDLDHGDAVSPEGDEEDGADGGSGEAEDRAE